MVGLAESKGRGCTDTIELSQDETNKSPRATMSSPAMDVHLLSPQEPVAAVIPEPHDCLIRCDAAINNGEVQEVDLWLPDLAVAGLVGPA